MQVEDCSVDDHHEHILNANEVDCISDLVDNNELTSIIHTPVTKLSEGVFLAHGVPGMIHSVLTVEHAKKMDMNA